MLIGWNGETMPALPLDEELGIVAAAGYGGMEFFVPKLAPYLQGHAASDLVQCLQEKSHHSQLSVGTTLQKHIKRGQDEKRSPALCPSYSSSWGSAWQHCIN